MAAAAEWSAIGARVRQVRLSMGMSQADLARAVGLDRTMLAKVEAGSRRLDAFELARLSAALRVSMHHLVEPPPAVVSRRSDLLTEDNDTEIARRSYRLEIELVEWLREVRQLLELGVLRLRPHLTFPGTVASPAEARSVAAWVREQLGHEQGPVGSMLEFCERAGQFVLVTNLPGDGASVIDGDVAVAVVSLQGDPGRRRATAAHELGHLVIGDEYSSDLGVHASRAEREAVIDAFAAELLLPMAVLSTQARADSVSRDWLVGIAARYRTSWSLALKQAEQAGLISAEVRQQWSYPKPTRAEFMEAVGWAPQPDLDGRRIPPSYASAVMEAWRRGLITRSRVVELMHGQLSESDLPIQGEPDLMP